MRTFLVLFALCTLMQPVAAAVQQPSSHLTVYFIGCSSEAASLDVFDMRHGREITTLQMQSTSPRNVQTASIALQEGYYEVGAGRLPCTATRHVVILAGVDRDIVLKGGDTLHLTQGKSGLGGSIPSNDLAVAAVCEDKGSKVEYAALVESRAYYFDDIETPTSCVLQVRSSGRNPSDLASSPTIRFESGEKLAIHNFSWPSILNSP